MKDIERFITGFRDFKKDYFGPEATIDKPLHEGQSPKTMIIGCSDSRVDPAILTNAAAGDIFSVRNVANLVPPMEKDNSHHGVSAALEYAVCHLNVDHVIVMGHTQCGGINALMQKSCCDEDDCFITNWMALAAPVREQIAAELPDKSPELQNRAAEQAAILLSLENLHSFPFVTERLEEGTLSLHGWYFDMEHGELLEYNVEKGAFLPIG